MRKKKGKWQLATSSAKLYNFMDAQKKRQLKNSAQLTTKITKPSDEKIRSSMQFRRDSLERD